MCIAEFCCVGFGVFQDKLQVASWVLRAAELGPLKALSWYPHICHANKIIPTTLHYLQPSINLEQKLSHLPSGTILVEPNMVTDSSCCPAFGEDRT
jgi:hypothetical protein